MPRIALPTTDTMTPVQRQAYDAVVAGRRGHAPAPFLAWLQSPEFASRAQKLGEFVRYETTMAPRLSELAILVVASWWGSAYEWAIHKTEALRAGVSADVIDDIAAQRTPRFDRRDDQAVFDFAMSLCHTRAVAESTYRRTVGEIGEQGVVELVGVLGYYTLISMTLNAFEIGPPAASS
ncbi:MAG: carboxymuconolactone decarboxylase family protein [Vicinamibacterales bacterium]